MREAYRRGPPLRAIAALTDVTFDTVLATHAYAPSFASLHSTRPLASLYLPFLPALHRRFRWVEPRKLSINVG